LLIWNILNKKKETELLCSIGLVLKLLKYQSKALKRSLKGIMLFTHFLKKIIKKKFNTKFLTIFIKKWNKTTFFFLKQLHLIFNTLFEKKHEIQPFITFVWTPKILFGNYNYKKVKSIKRRLKKKLILKDNFYFTKL